MSRARNARKREQKKVTRIFTRLERSLAGATVGVEHLGAAAERAAEAAAKLPLAGKERSR